MTFPEEYPHIKEEFEQLRSERDAWRTAAETWMEMSAGWKRAAIDAIENAKAWKDLYERVSNG